MIRSLKRKHLLGVLTPLGMTLGLFAGATCWADVTGFSGGAAGGGLTDIPDNDPGGITSTVSITDEEIITGAKFIIEGLDHEWVGDLTINVAHSTSGKSATLMHRVGGGAVGDSSNLLGDYSFEDGALNIWSEAANGGTTYNMVPDTYAASGAGESMVSLNDIFAGELTSGDWTFTIADNNAAVAGRFFQTGVEFQSVAVPEPGALGVLMVAGLVGLRRRRRSIA